MPPTVGNEDSARRPQERNAWLARHPGWRKVFIVEWALEWLAYWLGQLAIFDVLRIAGHCSIIVAVVFWFAESGLREREAKNAELAALSQAWSSIYSQPDFANSGRVYALQVLAERNELPPSRLALPGAFLQNIDLHGANLRRADFSNANLQRAKFDGAILEFATLSGAVLRDATLYSAWLTEASLINAHMERADLRSANLSCAHLNGADLSGADVQDANFYGADIRGAKLEGAKGLVESQIASALADESTTLPGKWQLSALDPASLDKLCIR
jgi:uncharacterized protein YjbI with pentapeptide repeats